MITRYFSIFLQQHVETFPVKGVVFLLTLSILALSGCSQIDRRSFVVPKMPAMWAGVSSNGAAAASAPWWETLEDPRLNILILEVLTRNRDIMRANLRIKMADASVVINESVLYPQFQAGMARTKTLTPKQSTSGNTSFSSGYAIDLWGRNHAGLAIDRLTFAMLMEEKEALRWQLSVRVAELYWIVAAADNKAPLLRDNRIDSQHNLEAALVRLANGSARNMEVAQCKADVQLAMAAEASLSAQRATAVSTLAMLLDDVPQEFSLDQATLPSKALPDFSLGVPATLLDRRPDIRYARLSAEAALQAQQVVKTAPYPRLNFSGMVSSGQSITKLLSNPLANLVLGFDLPYLDLRRVNAERRVAELEVEMSRVAFREVLYGALSQIESLFVERSEIDSTILAQQALVAEASDYARAMRLRYEAGAERRDVLRAALQKQRLSEAALIDSRLRVWLNYVKVSAAFGGTINLADNLADFDTAAVAKSRDPRGR